MTYIQFAPATPPRFRRVRTGRPVVAQVTLYQKPNSLRVCSTIFCFLDGTNRYIFIFSFLLFNLILFFRSGAAWPPVPPFLGYIPAAPLPPSHFPPGSTTGVTSSSAHAVGRGGGSRGRRRPLAGADPGQHHGRSSPSAQGTSIAILCLFG